MIARPVLFLAAGLLAAGGGLLTQRDDTSAGPQPPAALDGAALFQAKGCATCHTGPDSTSQAGVAPELDDLAAVAGTRIEGVSAADYVRRSIVDPSSFRAPAPSSMVEMPTLAVGPDELDALVAYLLATEE